MLSEGEKRVLLTLYLNKEGLHIREICRRAKLSLPSVAKHIIKGEDSGAIISEKKGSLKICRLNFKNQNIQPLLQNIESERFQKLPHKIQDSFNSFVDDIKEKPLASIIFGSYTKGNYTKKSDLDILLVFQRIDNKLVKEIEASARKIKGRTGVNVQPVSLAYGEFEKEFLSRENEFMKDLRKSALVLRGADIFAKLLGRLYI